MTNYVVLCFLILIITMVPADIQSDEKFAVYKVETLLGGVAKLPCDLTPAVKEDHVSLVIWYKDEAKTPIYSLDVRGRSLQKGFHWSDAQLGGRAYFTIDPEFSVLTLRNIKHTDSALYKCRVDFQYSPTRNSLVNFTVIVPPEKLLLVDSEGVAILGPLFGPVLEKSTIQISCLSIGGMPKATVSWWINDKKINGTSNILPNGDVKQTIVVNSVSRSYLGSTFTCQALNTHLVSPLTTSIQIDMLLKPLDVRLLGENLALSSGSRYEVACQSSGSRPAAVITWSKGGVHIKEHVRHVTSLDGNITTSTVTITPSAGDTGLSLSCRAMNPNMEDTVIEDSWTLNVHYPPVVQIELVRNTTSALLEGMDIKLSCKVKANPRVKTVSWKFNGQTMHHSASLLLPAVTRQKSGSYYCLATNIEGLTESAPFFLDIKYEPQCRTNQTMIYGISRMEDVLINCELDSNPPAKWFHWTLNKSNFQFQDLTEFTSSELGDISVLKYRPVTLEHYGTLQCWGKNNVGVQKIPCTFQIHPQGYPDSPFNCTTFYETALTIKCEHGYDGGLPQDFVAEVRTEGRLLSNVTNRGAAEFIIANLEQGKLYNVFIYAKNSKGHSSVVSFMMNSEGNITHLSRQSKERIDQQSLLTVLLVSSGIVLLSFILIFIIFFTLMILKTQREELSRKNSDKIKVQADKDSSCQLLEDERNPDVVPQDNVTELGRNEYHQIKENRKTWDTHLSVIQMPNDDSTSANVILESWTAGTWPSGCHRKVLKAKQKTVHTQCPKESTV